MVTIFVTGGGQTGPVGLKPYGSVGNTVQSSTSSPLNHPHAQRRVQIVREASALNTCPLLLKAGVQLPPSKLKKGSLRTLTFHGWIINVINVNQRAKYQLPSPYVQRLIHNLNLSLSSNGACTFPFNPPPSSGAQPGVSTIVSSGTIPAI